MSPYGGSKAKKESKIWKPKITSFMINPSDTKGFGTTSDTKGGGGRADPFPVIS